MIHQIIKRDGSTVDYSREKIRVAIHKANKDVKENLRATEAEIDYILEQIETTSRTRLAVEEIQDQVEEGLMRIERFYLAKEYILYREKHSLIRQTNTTDESIMKLISHRNKELNEENANKNPVILSTQRDYIAGETSKDISDRILLPERVVKAHKEGVLHFHDKDYFIQKGMFNCCLVNIQDMLDNGTVMNGKMIESPKSFQVACTVMTQIIAAVASNQYGGQSINIKHLGKYLRKTYDKALKQAEQSLLETPIADIDEATGQIIVERVAKERMLDDLKAGVQTIQYQINTLMTTNGQSPFVTLFLNIEKDDEYAPEIAMIIEEILNQRLQGIKNESGVYVTPAFPKLIYVLNDDNCLEGGQYDYLTKLAAKCSAKRMYPDYISAKIMKQNHDGEVFSPMGCRSFLSEWKDSDGHYKWEGRFNQGVVSLNLPQIGIVAKGNMEAFWTLLDERLELCKEALLCRHESLLGTLSDVSPIHWQYGAIARLKPGEVIDPYLMDGYSTISLGYIGLYELTMLMTKSSHTTDAGRDFADAVLNHLREKVDIWKTETHIGFGLYGTPAESLCYRFAKIDLERFGEIENVTDKGYYTNSYHVDVREKIDAFTKLQFESQFQKISSGGAISYVEVPFLFNNLNAIESVMKFMYNNIQYAEFNTKSDYCTKCGFTGEIKLNDHLEWECPNCHTTMNSDGTAISDKDTKGVLKIVRRTCGYLGENYFNKGKTEEIKQRVTHL